MMAVYCGFVYGGKCKCGVAGVRRRDGRGAVMMKIVVRFGIWVDA